MAEPIRTIVADPGWSFQDNLPGLKRGAAKHYRCQPIQEIIDTELPELAADCRLFLWRVASMQSEASVVATSWGFSVKAELVWIKTTSTGKLAFGMGRQVRNCHEICLIATRGNPVRLSASVRSVFEAQIGRHSEKPDRFYKLVQALSPGPYCELFARKRRHGWIQYGDELEAA